MAIVNKFNVNNKQVKLDADIIENMSANGVSYNASTQYDNNTVGNKLSKLESEIDVFKEDVTDEVTVFKETVTEQVNNYAPIVINGNVTNAQDEEDLTSVDGLLKFKNRSALNGMGYVILRKNKSFAEQVTKKNTIYEIRYDFDLEGETIILPSDCALHFNGGSLNNGILNFNNCYLEGIPIIKTFIRGKTKNPSLNFNWFIDKNTTNCSPILQNLIDEGNKKIIFPLGTYIFLDPIEINVEGLELEGMYETPWSLSVLEFKNETPESCLFHFSASPRYITIKNFRLQGDSSLLNNCFDFSADTNNGDVHFISLSNLYIWFFNKAITAGNSYKPYSVTLWNGAFEDIRIERCNYGLYLNGSAKGKHFGNIFKRVLFLSCYKNLLYIKDNVNINFEHCNFGLNNPSDIYIYGYDSFCEFSDCNIECDSIVTDQSDSKIIDLRGGNFLFTLCTFLHRDGSINMIKGVSLRGLTFEYCKYSGEADKFWGTISMSVYHNFFIRGCSFPSVYDSLSPQAYSNVVHLDGRLSTVNSNSETIRENFPNLTIAKRSIDDNIFYKDSNGTMRFLENNSISPFHSGATSERPVITGHSLSEVGYRFFDYEKKRLDYWCIDHYESVFSYIYRNDQNYGSSEDRPYTYLCRIGQPFFDTTLNIPIWYSGEGKWVDATGTEV